MTSQGVFLTLAGIFLAWWLFELMRVVSFAVNYVKGFVQGAITEIRRGR